MKAAYLGALALSVFALLALDHGVARSAADGVSCTAETAAKPGKPTKPSSFAPRTPPHNHAYGAPIQQPILKSHPRHKRPAEPSSTPSAPSAPPAPPAPPTQP
jgi:hypothetical protein